MSRHANTALNSVLDATRYAPLSIIDVSLLSPLGMMLVRCDPNLNPVTMGNLQKSEEKIINSTRYDEYKYLLDPHLPEEAFKREIEPGNCIGLAHISQLIREDTSQSYGSLVAGYAQDRNIPFYFAALILNDYRAHNHGKFILFDRTNTPAFRASDWEPPVYQITPPENMQKMFRSGCSSEEGYNDGYILKTLDCVSRNRAAAASILKVTRQTLTNKLIKMGYLLPDGNVRKDYDEWIRNEIRKLAETATMTSPSQNKPPIAKRGTEDTNKVSDNEIVAAYIENRYNKTIAAKMTGISYVQYKKRLSEIWPTLATGKNLPDELLLRIYVDAECDPFSTASILNCTPQWVERRIKKIEKAAKKINPEDAPNIFTLASGKDERKKD